MDRIVIAGTTVPECIAQVGYRLLADRIDANNIWGLPMLGLGHVREATDSIAQRIAATYRCPVDVFGHSQGGLVAALLACRYPHLVNKAVAAGAPLSGLDLAWVPNSAVKCMSRGSRLLSQLEGSERVLSIGGGRDLVVPLDATYLNGAHHEVLPGIGHFSLIVDKRVTNIARQFFSSALLQAA